MARLVVPNHPHHVTQRGVRRMATFLNDDDYRAYLKLVAEGCRSAGTVVWAYCLMPNHVHLILVPADENGLRAALGEAHRRYTLRINQREDWRGYLWQGRFQSFVMDQAHLIACARYVEQNPVRAGLAKRPEDWAWSSARAHLDGKNDGLVDVQPLLDLIPDWKDFLAQPQTPDTLEHLRKHGRTGRPNGDADWVKRLEKLTGRTLAKQKPGRKPRPTPDPT